MTPFNDNSVIQRQNRIFLNRTTTTTIHTCTPQNQALMKIVIKIEHAGFISAISSEKLIALNALHEGDPAWYSFHS